MNNAVFDEASDLDYLITNFNQSVVTPEWIVKTDSPRNWVERHSLHSKQASLTRLGAIAPVPHLVFYREAKGCLGLKEYQTRGKRSLDRHLILVFCAYTFILWHKLTGGLRRRWANKEIKTFPEALEAFRTAMSFRFVRWLHQNIDLFTAYQASLGFVWA